MITTQVEGDLEARRSLYIQNLITAQSEQRDRLISFGHMTHPMDIERFDREALEVRQRAEHGLYDLPEEALPELVQ